MTAILLTHSHTDHSGSAAAVKAESDVDLYAAEAEAPAIRGDKRPPSPPVPAYAAPFAWITAALPGPPPAVVDRYVGEVGLPADLEAVATPGHTPGHTSYLLDRADGVLFVGDAVRATRRGAVTRGFFNRSTPAVDASLGGIAELEFEMAVFGHSGPLRSGASAAFRRFSASLG